MGKKSKKNRNVIRLDLAPIVTEKNAIYAFFTTPPTQEFFFHKSKKNRLYKKNLEIFFFQKMGKKKPKKNTPTRIDLAPLSEQLAPFFMKKTQVHGKIKCIFFQIFEPPTKNRPTKKKSFSKGMLVKKILPKKVFFLFFGLYYVSGHIFFSFFFFFLKKWLR